MFCQELFGMHLLSTVWTYRERIVHTLKKDIIGVISPWQTAFQKKLLSKYAKDHHFPNPKFYVDDGYTGTNFNRPGFQEMIEDIEAGYVTTVIVKDTMLHELVERIDVYHIQGTGKNRTQRLVIHYKFVGVLDLPHSPVLPGNVVLNSRQGVEIEYLVGKAG